jgi:hypothetical protein
VIFPRNFRAERERGAAIEAGWTGIDGDETRTRRQITAMGKEFGERFMSS